MSSITSHYVNRIWLVLEGGVKTECVVWIEALE